MRIRTLATSLLLLASTLTAPTIADEWPSWRGPHQNGVSDDTGLISSWTVDGENQIWKAELIGRSTPVVFAGRVCVTGRVGADLTKQEFVACYDAGNGKKLWEHRFNVFHTTVPFSRVGWSRPVGDVATGNLYVHGVGGLLMGFDSKGKLLWEHSLTEEFGRFSGYGGRTHSPIVDEDHVIMGMTTTSWGDQSLPKHRIYAFDKNTGEVDWISDVAGPATSKTTYSTPVVAVIEGQRLLIGGNSDGAIYAVQARTGKLVWKFQLSKVGLNTSVAVEGNRVYAAIGHEPIDEAVMGRVVCIDATGTGDVTATHEVWRAPGIQVKYASPLIKDGILYVIDDSANLHALDADTGATLWVQSLGTVGKGSPVWADGKIYATEVNGHFWILKPSRTGVEILDDDTITFADGRPAEIYGSPAVAYGRIYFTSELGLYSLGDAKKKFSAKAGTLPPLDDGKAPKSALPATLLLQPADVLTTPGKTIPFIAYAFDDKGHPLGKVDHATYTLLGLDAQQEGDHVEPAAGAGGQAGKVAAQADELVAEARVRVVPSLPFTEDFESTAVGKHPSWFVAAGPRFKVEEKDGGKVLAKPFFDKGVERQVAYMGEPTLSGYTIQADLMGEKVKRTMPDMGLVNSRYTLDMMGNHQRLQIRDWAERPEIAQVDNFHWEPDTWYTMKMRVDIEGGKAIIRGKVWKKGDPEPEEWSITGEDPVPNLTGSPGLYGYSPTAIYYDNVVVTENR